MDLDAPVDLAGLTPVERTLLRLGVMEWERTDGDRETSARLLGYDDQRQLRADVQRLAGLVDAARPMTRRDCRRLLLATELAFASETLGWARDWEADTGFTDRDTSTVLRGIQERLAGVVHGSADRVAAAEPSARPAWEPIPMDADDIYWEPFHQRFAFRPGMRSWPAINEPVPSVTFDLAPIFAGSHPEFSAAASAVGSLALVAFARVLEIGTGLVVLDWQHQTFRFWPHLFACQQDQHWSTPVVPNGDYSIFLTEDMRTGTFGHPWEQTLCVFGDRLVPTLAPMLESWLPVKRSSR
ncbi:hypothetical protein GCM10009827_073180 [Dactylosporangium maewongense]|uniref:DUF2716 domain-containing protein n=1 Tax=Dactylosporangium maewongense TaxID=634393 RepID=A0ABP4MJB5_9ACTN